MPVCDDSTSLPALKPYITVILMTHKLVVIGQEVHRNTVGGKIVAYSYVCCQDLEV